MKSKNGKERAAARYHAAEHKVINAYKTLQRIPKVQEVRKASRFSSECGSNEIFAETFLFLVINVSIIFLFIFNSLNSFIILAAACLIAKILGDNAFLRFLQIFR